MEWRIENSFIAPELSVGTPGSQEIYRLLREILNAPTKQPTAAFDFSIPTKLLDSDLWLILTHAAHRRLTALNALQFLARPAPFSEFGR